MVAHLRHHVPHSEGLVGLTGQDSARFLHFPVLLAVEADVDIGRMSGVWEL